MRAVLVISILYSLPFLGQNLIPNGSFEDTIADCYYQRWIDPGTDNVYMAKGWYQPTLGTPDIKGPSFECAYTSYSFGSGDVIYPSHGDRYIGMITYSTFSNGNDYREYIGTELGNLLIKNKLYCLEYNLMLLPGSKHATTFGVLLSTDSINLSTTYEIPLTPIFEYDNPVIDTTWERHEILFQVDSSYKYIYFGNFRPDSLTTLDTTNGNYKFSFYCIDNLSLKLCPGQLENHLTVYPNPSDGHNIYIDHYADTTAEVKLYNSIGQLMGYKQLPAGEYNGEVFSNLAAGVYILRMQTATGYRVEEKVIVVK